MERKKLLLLPAILLMFSLVFVSAEVVETFNPFTINYNGGCDANQPTFGGLSAYVNQSFALINMTFYYPSDNPPCTAYLFGVEEDTSLTLLGTAPISDLVANFNYVNVSKDNYNKVFFAYSGAGCVDDLFTNCWSWIDYDNPPSTHPLGDTTVFTTLYPSSTTFPTYTTLSEMTDDGFPDRDTTGWITGIGIAYEFPASVPPSGGILHYDNLIEQQEEETPTAPVTGDVVTEPKSSFSFSNFFNNIINWFKNLFK